MTVRVLTACLSHLDLPGVCPHSEVRSIGAEGHRPRRHSDADLSLRRKLHKSDVFHSYKYVWS